MILRQTGALFLDAFRELHARKMFWLTMMLSGLIVLVFALIKVDNQGLHMLGWSIPGSEEFAARIGPRFFYAFFMVNIGINVWLAWAATIIALLSTASIIPDFIADGRIDTMLSKPLSRVRLFLTKYTTGLLFVGLQVLVFCVGSFLVMGLRAGTWEWGIFLAVPLVVLFFSYLFAFMSLMGLLTRSAMASVLITGLFWGVVFLVNMADGIMMDIKNGRAFDAEYYAVKAEYDTHLADKLKLEAEEDVAAGIEPNPRTATRIERLTESAERSSERAARAELGLPAIERWHGYLVASKTLLPKTSETVALLERHMIDVDEMAAAFPALFEGSNFDYEEANDPIEREEIDGIPNPSAVPSPQQRTIEESRSRTTLWVIGTSLGFEAFVLFVCCFIFARRDF